jgi:hypothetical protein
MITITYDEIYNKVFELSSYEAGRGVQDEVLFNAIVINERDRTFIESFANQAFESLGALLGFCLEDYEITGDGCEFTFKESYNLAQKEGRTKKVLLDATSTMVMSIWLDNKLNDRAKSYASMYTNMAGAIVLSAKLVAPKKQVKPKPTMDTINISYE